ncbi:peptide/nickel transport system substrate-binding protein [Arboricoccus pini]|uniref:Peptide/nickel transport system substrate-binding protein n=1 Tax=Arboricoccus pini TaxID=1963835 RepID=A0A212S2L0_9PROT|nr:ABC transporter substrate-binding protein [Arboricoccus pini]SNB79390.1 peptide/nickel transport system substrate-binding protein [Arboricoccus pini]
MRLDRRGFLSSTALVGGAGGLAAGLAPSFLLSDSARAAEPKKGGTLKLGIAGGSSTDSLDPRTLTDSVPTTIVSAITNALVEIDAKGQATPELATSWATADGAKTWVLKLKEGVAFHNGKAFEAEDAVYSINLHRGENTKSPAKSILSGIADIKASGPHELTVTLTEPNADLPYIFSDYHLVIVPKDFTDWAKLIGTGAFKLESFQPGVRASGVRNPDYWKAGRGNVDRFELTVINDGTARLNALISGQIDVMNRIDRKTVQLLQRAPTVAIVRSTSGQHYPFLMLCDRKPFDDNNLRLAVKYGIDRQQMVKTILNGFGTEGNDHPISPANPYYNSELPIRPYDPDKSKYYLKQAGMADFKVTLHTSDAAYAGAPDAAVLYRAQAKKGNVLVDVQRDPADGYWDNIWMKQPFCMSYWMGRPVPDMMFSTAYASDASWNDSYWKRPAFDKMLVEARGITDFDKRKAIYWDLQKMVHEDGGNMIATFADFVDGRGAKVEGFEPHPSYELSNFRIIEKAWLKA